MQESDQQAQAKAEVDLGEFLKGEAVSGQDQQPGPSVQAPVPPPICTNDQFVEMVHSILRDAVAGDLPDEVIVQLPSPHMLKVFLDIIKFEDASGLLGNLVKFDPQRTLWIGLGATGIYSAYFVLKAVSIKKALQKKGAYQQAVGEAARERREEYERIMREMQEKREQAEKGGVEGGEATRAE